jgi:hypothetical protein
VGNGAVIIANNTQTLHDAIDVRDGKADNLADVGQFKDAMSVLPPDSLVRGYANPSAIAQLASLAQLSGPDPATAQQLQTFAQSLSWMDSASVAMLATSGGYNTVFHVRIKDGADPGVYGSQLSGELTLTSLVPADAFLFVGSKLSGDAFKKALDQSLTGAGAGQLNQLEQITALVRQRHRSLFSGELLSRRARPSRAWRALLSRAIRTPAAAGLRHIMAFAARAQPGLRIHDLSGGREGQSLEVSPGFTFTWERKPGGLIAIGNDTAAGTDPGQALVDSPDYTSLLAKADVPDGATVAAYVSIPGISSSSRPRSTPTSARLAARSSGRLATATTYRSGCSSRSNSRAGGSVFPKRHPQRRADLAQRRVRLDSGHDRRHQIAAACRRVDQPRQGGRRSPAVALGARRCRRSR